MAMLERRRAVKEVREKELLKRSVIWLSTREEMIIAVPAGLVDPAFFVEAN